MDLEKKTGGLKAAPSPSVSDIEVVEAAPQQVSLGKKILYHLWDADQHLKSPEVHVVVENPCR